MTSRARIGDFGGAGCSSVESEKEGREPDRGLVGTEDALGLTARLLAEDRSLLLGLGGEPRPMGC